MNEKAITTNSLVFSAGIVFGLSTPACGSSFPVWIGVLTGMLFLIGTLAMAIGDKK